MSKTLPQERSQPDRMDEDDGTNTDTNGPTLTTPSRRPSISRRARHRRLGRSIPPSSAGITSSLTATGRTTRRTANFSTFGIGDAVTDAQFDLVLAQLGTADQKDPNIRAMKTTATVPDMALLPKHRLVSISDDENDTLISNWTAQEQEAFEKSYAAQPKQFGWIASQVKTRTRAECVIHYYRTKRENKYRNLHLPPQAVIEGKPRELRGKRSRKVPCKTLTTDAATNTLKPKLKTNPELPQPSGKINRMMNRPNFPTISLNQLLEQPLPQIHRLIIAATVLTNSRKPFASSFAPTIDNGPFGETLGRSRAELNELSTRSAESNPPTIMLTNQVPTAQFEPPMKPLDPRPAPSTAMPPKLHEQQPPDPPSHPPSKPPPRAYKKRKVHPTIDTSSTATLSSHPAPPTQPASAMDHSKVALLLHLDQMQTRTTPRNHPAFHPILPSKRSDIRSGKRSSWIAASERARAYMFVRE
ncbi:hypothetical protein PCASD_21375 [Puccinia coronata f. sp. avenae]|uniref:SANT domain-containing protein n=1 Tax=Puccinia coronata f. sp. avenae TaxID=200324 RepID=A0A2N5ST32_9BASI|nr:hypothetical protein PCASD_21375 [Puccinia coronata f. sp. avenae]